MTPAVLMVNTTQVSFAGSSLPIYVARLPHSRLDAEQVIMNCACCSGAKPYWSCRKKASGPSLTALVRDVRACQEQLRRAAAAKEAAREKPSLAPKCSNPDPSPFSHKAREIRMQAELR